MTPSRLRAAAAIRELAPLRRLSTPRRIQDFLDTLGANINRRRPTLSSPVVTLRRGTAHCLEGAMVAALALWLHGEPPLLLDLRATPDDDDHVIALYRVHGRWGAISKTNHIGLRFREPIYRDLRELAVSYFHEYFIKSGKKTLREYSRPFDLRRWPGDWIAAPDDLWGLQRDIDRIRHTPLVTRRQIARLRPADRMERRLGEMTEW